jgi:hypothetical protein
MVSEYGRDLRNYSWNVVVEQPERLREGRHLCFEVSGWQCSAWCEKPNDSSGILFPKESSQQFLAHRRSLRQSVSDPCPIISR